jgi:hypothetical protein
MKLFLVFGKRKFVREFGLPLWTFWREETK